MTDWKVARQAVRNGKTVFFPRLSSQNVWSIFANDRKKGLRIAVHRGVHEYVLGQVAWKIDEDTVE